MENIASMFRGGAGSERWSFSALLKNNDIDARMQSHLVRVYTYLAAGIVVTGLGAWVQIAVLPIPPLFCALGALAAMFACTAYRSSDMTTRLALAAGFALLKGMSLGVLVGVILDVEPSILFWALLLTTTAFACFSGFSLLSRRRSLLYLGSILSTCMAWLALASFMNLFMRSPMIFDIQLYGGLILFLGFVVCDTQMIIEHAAAGGDALMDAIHVYVDFVAIFVRIAIILLKKREGEKRDKNRR